jgi:hypothetical protein
VDRALGCGLKGRGFETLQARKGPADLAGPLLIEYGEVSEWLKELVSKTSGGLKSSPWVRIPPSPPSDFGFWNSLPGQVAFPVLNNPKSQIENPKYGEVA